MDKFGTPDIWQGAPEPARIKSVTIEGFRSLKNIQNLELPQLTVLIGANGAGKSTLIRFFEMLSWMLKARRLQEFVLRHGGGDEMARRIQFHQVTLHRQQRASGLTSITPEQRQLFAAIDLPEPSAKRL